MKIANIIIFNFALFVFVLLLFFCEGSHQTFPIKGQIVNIFGFIGHTFTTTHSNMNAAIDNV